MKPGIGGEGVDLLAGQDDFWEQLIQIGRMGETGEVVEMFVGEQDGLAAAHGGLELVVAFGGKGAAGEHLVEAGLVHAGIDDDRAIGIDHLEDGDRHAHLPQTAAGGNHKLGHGSFAEDEGVQAERQEAAIGPGELADAGEIQRIGGGLGHGGVAEQDISGDGDDNDQDGKEGEAGAQDLFAAGGFWDGG